MTRARDVANLIGSGNFSSTTFTATAGQTAFTISHTQGFIQVFMNGLLLDETADYTSNGSAVTLTSGAAAGDEIEVVKYNTFSVGDAIPASGGTFTGNVTHSGDVAINGTLTTTSTGTTLSSNSYNVVKIQTDKDDNGSNDDGILQFTTGSSNTVKGELRYDESESMFEIGHGDNQGHIRIDSSGRVLKPNQPAFGARNTGNASEFKGASSVYVNTGNHYNNTTGIFTAPIAGNYYFFGGGQSSSGGAFYWGFYKNGTQIYEFYNAMSGYTYGHASLAAVVPMAANDTLQFKMAGSITMNTGGQNQFSGFLIG